MALAKRQYFTPTERSALVRRLRTQLILDFVQCQLIPCSVYSQGAARQWALGNPLGWYNRHMANMQRFLEGCLVPNPQGLGSNGHG